MELRYRENSLELDIFDKKNEFPFQVIRYPHLDSAIPRSIPYGVFTGLLYRRYRICTRKPTFLLRSVELATILMDKRCSKGRLCSLFSQVSVSESSTSMEMVCELSIQTVFTAVGELFIARSHRERLFFYYFIYVYVGYTSHRADTRTEVCDSSLILWRR